MFLIDGRIFLFIMETARSGVLPAGDADAGGDRALCGHVRLFRPHPALARHLPHPGEGYCGCSARFRDSADFFAEGNFWQKVVFLEVAPTPSLPPGGEGGAPAPDEGEAGEWNHVTQLSAVVAFLFKREGFLGGTLLHVIPRGNGDPACWRPAWGGVRCAAMVGGCV